MQENCNTTPNNNRGKRAYRYRYIGIGIPSKETANDTVSRNTKKHPTIFHLYVPPNKQVTLEKAKFTAKREGTSLAKLFHKFLDGYVRDHYYKCNPQRSIVQYSGEPKVKANCHCGEAASYEVWAKNKWHGFLCEPCYVRNRDAGLLKRWRKL